MTTLWIEPFGGMAGDMLLAAFLDLDDPRFTLDDLRGLADDLVPGEARLELAEVKRGSIAAKHVSVVTPETSAPPHRHYDELERRISDSALSEAARKNACDVLWCIAEAEAVVHGTTPDRIHFHEVGAIDTLIDVCGAALALERLGVGELHASPPLLGSGTVRCAHGEMPVPPPAVVEILRGRPTRPGGGEGERLTPTGAALLATWTADFTPPPSFLPHAVGYGAGGRDPKDGPPNLVRVQLGESAVDADTRAEAWLMDVNLDDMTPEEIGHAVGALRAAGALEVWTSPLSMKKDRPGVLVSALARARARRALETALFEWTTTLGVRWTRVERTECARRGLRVDVAGVPVRIQVRTRPASEGATAFGERDLAPEHDDVVAAAEAAGLTLREARRRAIDAALAQLG
ncbi:MAG: nickel pincer cofactor biosynthesis protein LarC [bacterium]|nr:nickel pincer cofactor biosynthesis protein LarC [bacterium]